MKWHKFNSEYLTIWRTTSTPPDKKTHVAFKEIVLHKEPINNLYVVTFNAQPMSEKNLFYKNLYNDSFTSIPEALKYVTYVKKQFDDQEKGNKIAKGYRSKRIR